MDGPWSVRAHLVLMVALAAVALAGAAAYGSLWIAGEAQDRATESMELEAGRAASTAGRSIDQAKAVIAGLAAQPAIAQVFAVGGKGCTLQSEGDLTFARTRLDIIAPDGTVVCSSDPAATRSKTPVHDRAWVGRVMRTAAPVVEPAGIDGLTDRRATITAVRVPPAGKAAGAAALVGEVGTVARTLAGNLASEDVTFTLVDRGTGDVVATSGRSTSAFAPEGREGQWRGADGERRIFASADVRGLPWRIYAGIERDVVVAEARGSALRQGVFGIVALLVLVLAAWLLNRRVAGPLRAVTSAVTRANRDPDASHVPARGTAELVTLSRELNAMLDVRRGHEAQLAHQTGHDTLTGLPNEVIVRDRVDAAMRDRAEPAEVTVLWIGIAGLGTVSDGFGHQVRDRLIADVAARLSAELSPADTLARVSRAEFVVLLGDGGDAEGLAERLGRRVAEPFVGPSDHLVLGSAIGIASAPARTTGGERLLREADSAMREARRTRAAVRRFDGELQDRATEQLRVVHEIRRALDEDELVVHYQPLHDVASGRMTGVEALVRWVHPERGLVPPMAFIPVAEETGQIAEIGTFVLRTACHQAAAWAAGGHPLRVSVNVAVAQLRDERFVAEVASALADAGLPAGSLCLEVTESSLMRDGTRAAARLEAIVRLGVHVAIDDFGTGYSSLAYLHDLPADEIKIDRSFIGRLDRDPRDQHVVEAVIGMAQALGLTVVAEGVETEAQLAILVESGCTTAQGYLLARPTTAEALTTMLREREVELAS